MKTIDVINISVNEIAIRSGYLRIYLTTKEEEELLKILIDRAGGLQNLRLIEITNNNQEKLDNAC